MSEETPKNGDARVVEEPHGRYISVKHQKYRGPTRDAPKGRWVTESVVDYVDPEPTEQN